MATSARIVWWLKKDFRLSDNPALVDAIRLAGVGESGGTVTPLFIFEPSAMESPETSAFHVAAVTEAIRGLRKLLRPAGGEVLVARGEVVDVLSSLQSSLPIDHLVSHEEIGTLRTYDRDRAVRRWCDGHGVPWTEHRQTGVFRRLSDRDARSKHWRAFVGQGVLPSPGDDELKRCKIPKAWSSAVDRPTGHLRLSEFGMSLDPVQKKHRQHVDAPEADRELESFLFRRGLNYAGGISSPNEAFVNGSRMSVHLAWGTITGREVYTRTQTRMDELKESDDPDAGRWRRSLSSFRSRLNWRDHFTQRLETEPTMEKYPLNRAYEDLPTTDDPSRLRRLLAAETGFPLVDACIACAWATGFLNFRMRCMITSFACHALRIDWRELMWPMARWWADYEPGIHVAQLQMQAGVVGINTLRTYNPAKQIADHDADAVFIHRWVPELRSLSPRQIIDHQEDPHSDYIRPIVDWRASTTQMRAEYYAIRRMERTRELAKEVLDKHGSRKSPSARKRTGKKRVAKKAGVKKRATKKTVAK